MLISSLEIKGGKSIYKVDNNKAELKGVLAIKPHSVLGFWMGLPIADTKCPEVGILLIILSVNEISFCTMAIFFNI